MDLKFFWAVLARRWYLVLLVIACGVGAAFVVVVMVGPSFQAKGAGLIFPPVATVKRGAETVTQGNPYLALEGVGQARDIVIRELTSKTTTDDFALKFPGSSYEATPDLLNNAPIIAITVEAPTEAAAIAGVQDLAGRIPDVLNDLQANLDLDANSVITSRSLTQDSRAEALHKDQIRAAVVATVVTLGLGLLAIALIDNLLTARRKRRQPGTQPDSPVTNTSVRSAAPPFRSPIADSGENGAGAEHRAEGAQVVKPAGANRLRPRSPSTVQTPASVNGSAKESVPETRRGKHGSTGATDRTQRG